MCKIVHHVRATVQALVHMPLYAQKPLNIIYF